MLCFTRASSSSNKSNLQKQNQQQISMARLASISNPVAVYEFQPNFSRRLVNSVPSLRNQTRRRLSSSISCQSQPNQTDPSSNESETIDDDYPVMITKTKIESSSSSSSTSVDNGLPVLPNKSVNRAIAAVSTLAAVGLFLSGRLDFGVSLKDLSAAALPYEVALSNGKPTVVEFYADWCEVCRELAPDVYKVEQQYKDSVNFVMLNVDNTNWEQELDEFGVEGIPHFAFLDKEGNEEGNVVGKLPRQLLLENVDALSRGEASIPHSRVVGRYSSAEARKVHLVPVPRSHG